MRATPDQGTTAPVAPRRKKKPLDPIVVEIRRLRTERGWTQAQLAAAAGTDENQVCAVENGYNSPSLKWLRCIFDALVVDLYTGPKLTGRQHRPCGTPAGIARHRYHQEPLCPACLQRDALRTQERRTAAARRRPRPPAACTLTDAIERLTATGDEIPCTIAGTVAVWTAAQVAATLEDAARDGWIGWVAGPNGHDLAAIDGTVTRYFAVTAPAPTPAPLAVAS